MNNIMRMAKAAQRYKKRQQMLERDPSKHRLAALDKAWFSFAKAMSDFERRGLTREEIHTTLAVFVAHFAGGLQ